MSKPQTLWKAASLIIFLMWLMIGATATVSKNMAFGFGLGDIFWYGLMYVIIIIQAFVILRNWKKDTSMFQTQTIIFGLLLVWFCLEATLLRNIEYPWNGHIFY